jgi:hypothetical protein
MTCLASDDGDRRDQRHDRVRQIKQQERDLNRHEHGRVDQRYPRASTGARDGRSGTG